jgi:hypothetical protein
MNSIQSTVDPSRLAAVVRSTEWLALATDEDKIYFVNKKSQETSWEMPSVPVPQSLRQPKVVLKESPEPEPVENGVKNGHVKYSPPLARKVEDPVLIKRSATTAGVIKRGSIKLEPEAVEWLQSAVCLSLVHSLSIENFFVLMKIGVFVL